MSAGNERHEPAYSRTGSARWWVALGVLLWPIVGVGAAAAGTASYVLARALHIMERRHRRGDDSAIPIQTTTTILLIPSVSIIGSVLVSMGSGRDRVMWIAIGVVVVVETAWLAAYALAQHETGRGVNIWVPSATERDVRVKAERDAEVFRGKWFPALGDAATKRGTQRAEAVPSEQLAGGDPESPLPSAHRWWADVRDVVAVSWRQYRWTQLGTWAWAAALAVIAITGYADGATQSVAPWVGLGHVTRPEVLGLAILLALAFPLGALGTGVTAQESAFLCGLRRRVLKDRAAKEPEELSSDHSGPRRVGLAQALAAAITASASAAAITAYYAARRKDGADD